MSQLNWLRYNADVYFKEHLCDITNNIRYYKKLEIMRLNIKLFTLFFMVIANTNFAQTTAIPDQAFEQALIDMNIDSDGIVNGQVLTADIENIIELNFSNLYDPSFYDFDEIITDFTGIEAFSSLEILNVSNLWIELSGSQTDVFNSNFNLKEFIADNSSFDSSPSLILPDLDFSNLANLEYISLYNKRGTLIINLKNPNITRTNLTINLDHEYWDPPRIFPICINVNNAEAAIANTFPYNTWNVISQPLDENGYAYVPVNFSSTCNLSINDFGNLSAVSIYPNPVKDKLWLDNPNQIKINKIEIYDISGQIIKSFSFVGDFFDVENLSSGVYFVRISNETSSFTHKMLKM